MDVKISPYHKKLLDLILTNKYIANNVLMGDTLAGNIEINDDGSIRLYTKHKKLKWLCLIFGDYKEISFTDLALNLIDIISGPDNKINSKVFDGLTKEFMENAIRNKRYDYIIDMLFDVLRFGMKDGEYQSQYINLTERQSSENNGCIGKFQKQRCSVVLNTGDVLDEVDVFTRIN